MISVNRIYSQRDYRSYDGTLNPALGFTCILIGGISWGLGMLLIRLLGDNKGKLNADDKPISGAIIGILCAGGGLTFLFGLVMIGIEEGR